MAVLRILSLRLGVLFLLIRLSASQSSKESQAAICTQNPWLHFCRYDSDPEIRRAPARDKKAEKDKKACKVLQEEYDQNCRDVNPKDQDEFCSAYKNVCFTSEAQSDVQQAETTEKPTETTPAGNSTRPNYHAFCKNYNQRFKYVCPEPLRFGPRAAVFCPIYSERCDMTPPERSVLPTAAPRPNPMVRMCGQYTRFASSYCTNQFALQYSQQVRDGCSRYQQFCSNGMRRMVVG
ncbi:hypothetical protein M3Y99_00194500 [Aphelenchoides fujianensis]|nr:hypothetical protein M3Y99_00194500 [Aphelenchoides fujianensis]